VTLSRNEGFNQFYEVLLFSVAESIKIKRNQKWFCMSYLVYDTSRLFSGQRQAFLDVF